MHFRNAKAAKGEQEQRDEESHEFRRFAPEDQCSHAQEQQGHDQITEERIERIVIQGKTVMSEGRQLRGTELQVVAAHSCWITTGRMKQSDECWEIDQQNADLE